jgi:hypothetical protein
MRGRLRRATAAGEGRDPRYPTVRMSVPVPMPVPVAVLASAGSVSAVAVISPGSAAPSTDQVVVYAPVAAAVGTDSADRFQPSRAAHRDVRRPRSSRRRTRTAADRRSVLPPGRVTYLELVHEAGRPVEPRPTEEDLLVIYIEEPVPDELVARLEEHGGKRVASPNPYWNEWGVTVEDSDGCRLVLCVRGWSNDQEV